MLAASFLLDSRIIYFTSLSLLAASMEGDGITSETGLIGRGSVNAIGALVGSVVPFFKNARDSATGCF